MESKKYKINTTTFDHIEKDEFTKIIDELNGDVKQLERTLIRKTVVHLVQDYDKLRIRMLIFNVAQLCIDGVLIAMLILK